MGKKKRPNKQFRETPRLTRAQKRELGLVSPATGHPQRMGSSGAHEARPRGERDRSNARRRQIAFEIANA